MKYCTNLFFVEFVGICLLLLRVHRFLYLNVNVSAYGLSHLPLYRKREFFEFLPPDDPEFHDASLSGDPTGMLYLPTSSGFLYFSSFASCLLYL